jgi:hypothetical protein
VPERYSERYCSNCGQELRPEDRYCSNCGKPVHVPTPEADVPVPPPQQAKRTAPLPHPAGASSTRGDRQPDEPSGQAPFSIKEIAVLGVGGGVFALLTSRWVELPGTLFFAVLTPMMGAMVSSIIKAYLSGAAIGGKRLAVLGLLTALWRFGALPRETKLSVLSAVLRRPAVVGLVSSVISVSTVFGIQAIGDEAPNSGSDGRTPTSASSSPSPSPSPSPSSSPSPSPVPSPSSSPLPSPAASP